MFWIWVLACLFVGTVVHVFYSDVSWLIGLACGVVLFFLGWGVYELLCLVF